MTKIPHKKTTRAKKKNNNNNQTRYGMKLISFRIGIHNSSTKVTEKQKHSKLKPYRR